MQKRDVRRMLGQPSANASRLMVPVDRDRQSRAAWGTAPATSISAGLSRRAHGRSAGQFGPPPRSGQLPWGGSGSPAPMRVTSTPKPAARIRQGKLTARLEIEQTLAKPGPVSGQIRHLAEILQEQQPGRGFRR
jgi:hypothetical protein